MKSSEQHSQSQKELCGSRRGRGNESETFAIGLRCQTDIAECRLGVSIKRHKLADSQPLKSPMWGENWLQIVSEYSVVILWEWEKTVLLFKKLFHGTPPCGSHLRFGCCREQFTFSCVCSALAGLSYWTLKLLQPYHFFFWRLSRCSSFFFGRLMIEAVKLIFMEHMLPCFTGSICSISSILVLVPSHIWCYSLVCLIHKTHHFLCAEKMSDHWLCTERRQLHGAVTVTPSARTRNPGWK